MAGEQSASERRAQSSASSGGFGFVRRKLKNVGSERIGELGRPSRLVRGLGDQGESMQPIGEFRRQQVIDETVPLDSATAVELGGNHPDTIMRAPAFARARMSGVKMRTRRRRREDWDRAPPNARQFSLA